MTKSGGDALERLSGASLFIYRSHYRTALRPDKYGKDTVPLRKCLSQRDGVFCYISRTRVFYFISETLRLINSAKSLPFSILLESKARSISCFTRLSDSAKAE